MISTLLVMTGGNAKAKEKDCHCALFHYSTADSDHSQSLTRVGTFASSLAEDGDSSQAFRVGELETTVFVAKQGPEPMFVLGLSVLRAGSKAMEIDVVEARIPFAQWRRGRENGLEVRKTVIGDGRNQHFLAICRFRKPWL